MIQARIPLQTDAIVLRVIDYGESDRIVTFCTADFGKIRGIAKGARRSRKRFANALEPFSCSRIHFSRSRPESLALIEGCDSPVAFSRHPQRSGKNAGRLLPDRSHGSVHAGRQKERSFVFPSAGFSSDSLEGTAMTEALLRFFEIRLLRISGYDPVLDHCLGCQNADRKTGGLPFRRRKRRSDLQRLRIRKPGRHPRLPRDDPDAAPGTRDGDRPICAACSSRVSPQTKAGDSLPISSATSSEGS